MSENAPPPPGRTGEILDLDGESHLVLTRTYRAAPEDVWAAVTEAERLERWFGTWRGDPTTGRIEVAMTFDDLPFEPYVIDVCEPPHRLRLHSVNEDPTQNWTLDLRIVPGEDGHATFTLAQLVEAHTDVSDVGPGWEYQLGRLTAYLAGDDATSVTFEPYATLEQDYAADSTG